MKKFLFVIMLACGLLTVSVAAQQQQQQQQQQKAVTVPFKQYTSYFERNDSPLKGEAQSFDVIGSQEDFDSVFGAAAIMGANSFMPDNVFEDRFVVTTIKRGSMRRYSNVRVMKRGGSLYVMYTAVDDPKSGATFSVPLIVSVDDDDYSQIVFVENRKIVKKIAFGD